MRRLRSGTPVQAAPFFQAAGLEQQFGRNLLQLRVIYSHQFQPITAAVESLLLVNYRAILQTAPAMPRVQRTEMTTPT